MARQAACVRPHLEHRDEADDRRDQDEVEDVETVRVRRRERVRVDDADPRVRVRDSLEDVRDRRTGCA
jgi:hypothetical protein